MTSLQLELVTNLRAKQCCCGASKVSGFTFCGSCYHRLSQGVKKDLFQLWGPDYWRAAAEAKAELHKLGRIELDVPAATC